MRDRRDNRDISPKYRGRMRDRRDNRGISPKYRDQRHHHVDRRAAMHHHEPAPPRLVRVSLSPPIRAPPPPHRRSPPHRTDLMPRQLDRNKTVHREYLSPHHPRGHHSPTTRDYLHAPSYMHQDYRTDVKHGIRLQPHGLDPHPFSGHKGAFLDDRPSRSYPVALNQGRIMDGMLPGAVHDSSLHHRHGLPRDLYGGDRERERERKRDSERERDRDRHMDRDRGRDRETGKGLYQREVPNQVKAANTPMGPIEVGQSSYGHERFCYEHELAAPEDISKVALGRLPDDVRKSRDRVSDRYDKLVLDDIYEKMPYPSLDYSRANGMAYSPKSVREERVYGDIVHHSTHKNVGPTYHEIEEGLGRPLPRREAPLPFEDRHEFQREVARVVERDMPQSPILPDRAKGSHRTDYRPPHNGYVDDPGYEPSHERLMAREHHLRHVHGHDNVHDRIIYDDRIFDDEDDDNDDVDNDNDVDEVSYESSPRITVKDRLNLAAPLVTDVDCPIIRRAAPSRKPAFVHGKHHYSHNMSVPAAMRNNNVKKRLRLGPSDPRKENFRANKIQRRGTDYEPNITKVNDEYEKGSDEDAANMISPVLRADPPEGSDEFNKQVEKAFFKYAKIINESTREKKKLQHGKGTIVCYACGRQSKEFAETHNLVVHAFHTRKPGLRTAHLGLQKALCLLMGWNWLITPDESKQYQSGPPGEAKVLKQDLILWPPIVLIRNSSIDCSASESKTISTDMIESMLNELGIEEGTAKVSCGKPSNLSVISVKFLPRRSGFELAEKLHNHFHQANHGKEHLATFLKSATSATCNKKVSDKEIQEVLYGYMAGIEDLENLDSDTKRVYLAGKDTIRSKKVMKTRINEESAT